MRRIALSALLVVLVACNNHEDVMVEDGGSDTGDAGTGELEGGPGHDGGVDDGGETDAGDTDAGGRDAGDTDAGDTDAGGRDAGTEDAGPLDAGFDAGPLDAGFDAGPLDAGFDAGPLDAGFDAGPPTALTCVTPSIVNTVTTSSVANNIHVDQNDDTMVLVWEQDVSTSTGLFAATYDFATATWSAPQMVHLESTGVQLFPDPGIDSLGNMVVSYRVGVALWAAVYDVTTGIWTNELVQASVGNAVNPSAGYDRVSGQALIAYIDSIGGVGVSLARRTSAGVWSRLHVATGTLSFISDLKSNSLGDTILVWTAVNDVWVLVLPGGVTPTDIDGDLFPTIVLPDATSVQSAQVAIAHDARTALVSFYNYVNPNHQVAAFFVDTSTGTVSPFTNVATGTSHLGVPAVALNANHALVRTGNSGSNLSRWDGASWTTTYDALTTGGSSQPDLAVGSDGSAFLSWTAGSTGLIATRTYGPNATFLAPASVTGAVASSGTHGLGIDTATDEFLPLWVATPPSETVSNDYSTRCY